MYILPPFCPRFVYKISPRSLRWDITPNAMLNNSTTHAVCPPMAHQVTSSAKLKRLLAVVLAVGNFLNEGTRSGGANAITLDSLLKLPTVRCANESPHG